MEYDRIPSYSISPLEKMIFHIFFFAHAIFCMIVGRTTAAVEFDLESWFVELSYGGIPPYLIPPVIYTTVSCCLGNK